MNHNNITPEECRIAARLLRRDDFQADCGGYHAEADWFERKAEQIEREQDEKRRFTEAFHIFDQARRNYWTQPTHDDRPAYIPAAEDESYRAGVRALLKWTEQAKRDTRTWNDMRNVPADVKRIVGSNSSLVAYRDETAEHGWMWDLRQHDPAPVSESGLTYSAPFIEAPDDV